MKLLFNFLFLVFTLILVSSCVSLERNIYFQSNDPNLFFSSPRHIFLPGERFSSRVNINGNTDRRVWFEIENRSYGAYAWGVIVPVIPVFFWPGFRFKMSSDNLKINCRIDYFYDLVEMNGYKNFSDEDKALFEESKRNPDICISATITIGQDSFLKPMKIETNHETTTFTYNISASEIHNFIIEDIDVKLRTGGSHQLSNKFEVVLKDWTRLYYPSINN